MMRKLFQKFNILKKKMKKKMTIRAKIISNQRLITTLLLSVFQKVLLGWNKKSVFSELMVFKKLRDRAAL